MSGTGAGGIFGFSLPLFLAFIINLLILGLTIFGLVSFIVWLVRRSNRSNQRTSTPLDIAKERYARGEIDKAAYEEIKKSL
jgi:uncharacterized membrane protein